MFKNLIPWRHARDTDLATTDTSDEMTRFRSQFDQMLSRLFDDDSAIATGWGCDVQDGEDSVTVRAEAPGFQPEEIDVQLSGNRLVMQAEHREESKTAEGQRSQYGRLYRSVMVPSGIEADQIQATYKNGVLEIKLPKNEAMKSKRIEIAAQ